MGQNLRETADVDQERVEKGRIRKESKSNVRRIRGQYPCRRIAPLRQSMGRHGFGNREMAIEKITLRIVHQKNKCSYNRTSIKFPLHWIT